AQHTFYLWKRDPEKGMLVLDGLSNRAAGPLRLPDLGAAEFILALSGAILGQTRDAETSSRLLAIGRKTLRQVLLLGDPGSRGTAIRRWQRVVASFVREQVVDFILSFTMRMLSGWSSHAWASLDTMGHFLKLSIDQKELLRTLIPLLMPDTPGVNNRVLDMLIVEEWGDAISQIVVEFSLLSHSVNDLPGTLPVVEQLIAKALQTHPPRFWVYGPAWAPVWACLARGPKQEHPDPTIEYLAIKVASAIQEDPNDWLEAARKARPVPIPSDSRASSLGLLAWSSYILRGHVDSPELRKYLDRAKAAKDVDYLISYVCNEVTVMIESGFHQAAFEALLPIADYEDQRVREALIERLVRIRQYEPEKIEDWFLEHELPQEITQRVLAYPPSEGLNDLLTYQLLWILYDLFLWGPKFLQAELQWLLFKALELPNIREWLKLIIKELFNLIAGEPVLKVPADAPSRQLSKV
ncbi:MAG: hypothetical protein NT169_18325, partial [Chloroflexi bacterium]|nr:hypothetical protein [Chloroflexota bacterium]